MSQRDDMTNTKDGDMTGEWKCPHCKSNEGYWFDRSCDAYGGGMATRCNACGKDIDERKDVDMDREQLKTRVFSAIEDSHGGDPMNMILADNIVSFILSHTSELRKERDGALGLAVKYRSEQEELRKENEALHNDINIIAKENTRLKELVESIEKMLDKAVDHAEEGVSEDFIYVGRIIDIINHITEYKEGK